VLQIVERDFALLDRFYPGTFRRDVSFHAPPDCILWRELPGFRSTYAPRWRGRYIADSRGRFDYGDPEDHMDGRALQLNLHPEHWMTDGKDFLSVRPENDRAWFEPFFREPIWF
jgi:hypothetical protein